MTKSWRGFWRRIRKWREPIGWLLLLPLLGWTPRILAVRGHLLDPRAPGTTTIDAGPFPRRLNDPVAGATTLPRPPQRIVSSVLAADEILLEITAPTRLAAVTRFVDDPAFSGSVGRAPANLPRISGNLETVVSLTPDLVILAPYNRAETVTQLASLAIPLVRIDRFTSLADVKGNVRLLGRATGADDAAEALVHDLDGRIERVEARVRNFPRPRVLFWQPGGYTVGRATITDEIIERAGGDNVAREAHFEGNAVIAAEAVLGLHPDVIVLSVPAMTPQADAAALLPDDPIWRTLAHGAHPSRVIGVPAAWISSVSQHAVQGLESLATLLHPEVP